MAEILHRTDHPPFRVVDDPRAEIVYRPSMAARVVWFITYIVMVLLAVRFTFALLAANPANGLASFVYNVTQPLVAPFFNLFNYNYIDGAGRFEAFTLVALAIYGLVGYGLIRMLSLGRR